MKSKAGYAHARLGGMVAERDGGPTAKAISEPDETEAFARVLYSAFGGFVDWELLPPDSRSKEEYRENARDLLKS